jgi:hypothetical protein
MQDSNDAILKNEVVFDFSREMILLVTSAKIENLSVSSGQIKVELGAYSENMYYMAVVAASEMEVDFGEADEDFGIIEQRCVNEL